MSLVSKTNLIMLVVIACAQFAAGGDTCTGAVDPYDIVSEKGRFYAAAGRDNELSATEFGANKISTTSFRRSFDRWSEMLKFDKDANKSLDWVEAGAYRYTMRQMVLTAYDANRDGKLTGDERTAACKAVGSGKIRFATKPAPPPLRLPHKDSKDHKGSSHKGSTYKSSRKPDKHHDSKSSDAARAAQKAAQLREIQKKRDEYQAKRDVIKFDKNRNGKLDGNEIAERDKYNAEAKKRMSEGKKRYSEFLKKYDKNGDGKISDSEREAHKTALREESAKRAAAAKEANRKKFEEKQRKKEEAKFDKNKDGRLDGAELAELRKHRDDHARRLQESKDRKAEFFAKYDSNRDGKISPDEKKAYLQQLKADREARDSDKHKDRVKDKGNSKGKKNPGKSKPPKIKKKRSKKDR